MLVSDKETRLRHIINQSHDRLLSFLLSFTADRHLCEDILQEVYIRFWNNMDQVTDDTSAIHLLKRYTRNLFIDEMRKLSRKEAFQKKLDHGLITASVEDQAINKETYETIQQAIDRLPEQQRLIFRLHKEHAMSYREIATELGIATGTIETQMNRALKFLRQELKTIKIDGYSVSLFLFYCSAYRWME